MQTEWQTEKTLVSLLLQEMPDLGLHCLGMGDSVDPDQSAPAGEV